MTALELPRIRKAQAFVRWFEQDTGLGIARWRRTRTMVLTRWAVMLVLDSWGLSSVEVGDLIQRDHSTVLHGLIRGRQIPEVVKYADAAKERFEAEWLSRQPNHMTMLSGIT